VGGTSTVSDTVVRAIRTAIGSYATSTSHNIHLGKCGRRPGLSSPVNAPPVPLTVLPGGRSVQVGGSPTASPRRRGAETKHRPGWRTPPRRQGSYRT
jgi:hypothetical protein